jgi:hypothetical protein
MAMRLEICSESVNDLSALDALRALPGIRISQSKFGHFEHRVLILYYEAPTTSNRAFSLR